MKKRRMEVLGLLLVCFLLMSGRAAAVMRNTVFLEETGSGAAVSVRLEEERDDILSLGLRLQVSFTEGDGSAAQVSFAFDSAIGTKVMEYRYNAEQGILSLYISGQQNLFTGQELKLGAVTVGVPEGSEATVRISVVEDSLQLVNAAYDGEDSGEVSAPEAPEFTVSGQPAGGTEITPPAETQAPNSNPGEGSGENPGSASGETPTAAPAESSEAAAIPAPPAQSKPAAATEAATQSQESEGHSDSQSTEADENAGQAPSESLPRQTEADSGISTEKQPSQGSTLRTVLFGILAAAGVGGIIVLCMLADQYSRSRKRRRRQRARAARRREEALAARHAAAAQRTFAEQSTGEPQRESSRKRFLEENTGKGTPKNRGAR